MAVAPEDIADSLVPVLCFVCGDRSSGRHYGVLTCDGCRGFFKRSVRRGVGYECREKNDCVVDLSRRNQCQACRMKKCLDVGMKKEAVQHERAPRLPRNKTHHFSPYPRIVDYGKIAAITSSGNKSRNGEIDAITPPYSPKKSNLVVSIDELFELSVHCLHETISWARHMPSFADLPTKDQMLLLASAWCPLFLLMLSHYNVSISLELLLKHGPKSKSSEIKRRRDKHADDDVTSDLTALLSIIQKFKILNLDAIEFSCARAILLCNPELANLKSRTQVGRIQDQAQIVLQEHSSLNPSSGRFGKILLKLPSLATISTSQVENHFFRGALENVKNVPDRVNNVPDLYATSFSRTLDENNNNMNSEEEIEVEIIDLDCDE